MGKRNKIESSRNVAKKQKSVIVTLLSIFYIAVGGYLGYLAYRGWNLDAGIMGNQVGLVLGVLGLVTILAAVFLPTHKRSARALMIVVSGANLVAWGAIGILGIIVTLGDRKIDWSLGGFYISATAIGFLSLISFIYLVVPRTGRRFR